MQILKFGGSSVSSPERIRAVIDIVRDASAKDSTVVVVSAFGGVTDSLLQISRLAAASDEGYRDLLGPLVQRHFDAIDALFSGINADSVRVQIEEWVTNLRDTLHGVFLVKELSPRSKDFIQSFGERCSAAIVAGAMSAHSVHAEFVDARGLVRTNEQFGNAAVDFESTAANIRRHFELHKEIQVVTGFIGSSPSGHTTTLGRGGSDLTAAIFGAALKVSEIQLWTDVDGMLTADPRKVPKAFPIPSLSYEEAMELCHFGAKVIYPPTMQPARDHGIPIRICNTFRPDQPGTRVELEPKHHGYVVSGVSSIPGIALLRLEGSGMVGVPGISMRLFGALAREKVNVVLISQASSEHSICWAVSPEQADLARSVVDAEFELEQRAKLVEAVLVERDLAVVSVVGENMRRIPGIAARLFQALGCNGVNVVAIAQGSSELNISVVVGSGDEAKALNAIHDQFFLSKTKSLNVHLAGVGLIGSTFLSQVEAQRAELLERYSLDLRIVLLANSKRCLAAPKGVELSNWLEALSDGAKTNSFADVVSKVKELNLPNSVFVDCTASDEVASAYPDLLRLSVSVVTPNKRAQSGSVDSFRQLKEAVASSNAELLYETSVGAGLPIISTLSDLRKSGDQILGLEAVLSGTLSYIFNTFSQNASFSAVVSAARERGFTEPDPREDLNGLDVARKLLILGREAGLDLEPEDIDLENLVPEDCRAVDSVDDFLQRLRSYDEHFGKRLKAAADKGCKLCYIAALRAGRASVALEEIGPDHPFFGLSGSDNIVAFKTTRYSERPLVVKGPGAGADVTAAGVFADVIRLANYM